MPRRTVTSLAFNMSVSTRGFFSPQDLKKAEARVQSGLTLVVWQ